VANITHQIAFTQGRSERSKGNALVGAEGSTGNDTLRASPPLPSLRFEIPEAARILRMSRAALYIRISRGSIRAQKDGARTYITLAELERYVASCD
jgi:helix-turn-helix protein